MARVLVVGTDIGCEQALLRRLQQAAALPEGRVRGCDGLDDCDLLVIRDTPALRRAATQLLHGRPQLRCWVEGHDGRLRGNGQAQPLDESAIREALHGMQPAAQDRQADIARTAETAGILLAEGAHGCTQCLREQLQARTGGLVIWLDEAPLLYLDLEHDAAVPLGPPEQDTLGLLVQHFDDLRMHAVDPGSLALAAARSRQTLRPLLWQWGLRATHWQALDAQLGQGMAVRLQRWPDFRVLGHDHDGFRLCSLLLKRACSVAEAGRLLDLDPGRVRTFVHAAYLGGYARLEVPADAAPPTSLRAPAAAGLLARMWRSMRGRR